MKGVLRRHLLSIVCLGVAGLIGVAAIADHRSKNQRIYRAEVDEWYCTHLGTRCGRASSARIEAHWQRRQVGYEIAVITLGGFAIASFVYRVSRGPRSSLAGG